MYGLDEWQLFYLSQALTRAKRLEIKREEYYRMVHSTIIYPSVQLDRSILREHSAATEAQALRIYEMKQRYDGRIRKEYERYIRWKSLLDWVSESDKTIMIRYFQKRKYVNPKTIQRILKKISDLLNEQELAIERQRDRQALEEWRMFMTTKRSMRVRG